MVTGATDGIGRAYAIELARRRMNVVLISRSQERLKQMADELAAQFPTVQTRIVVADFGGSRNLYDHIDTALRDLDIGVLVNNVGVSYEYPDEFLNLRRDTIWSLIDINVGAVTLMTHIVLPGMAQRYAPVPAALPSAPRR